MKLQPWYRVVYPREDLRDNKPLDAAEFAVHLNKVQDGNAPDVYRVPEQFFARTYLTQNLTGLAAEVVRRLTGEKTQTSAVFNMATQFGGGKTHALTLLYHLAQHGPAASRWPGVSKILERAGVAAVPMARPAVFVGQQFDPRGGDDGTPYRRTPWGEIAWQLAGADGFNLMATFDQDGVSPGGDTIGRLFRLVNRPVLILVDELMNFVSRNRRSGLGSQTYYFLQNLSEEARSHDGVVLAVSIPASELEMTAEDQSDYERFKKMLDRLGKAVVISAEAETSEIIRRRLFEWDEKTLTPDGRVLLPKAAEETSRAYAEWVIAHRQQLPNWFPVDNAQRVFLDTYPFHPSLLSVFERKWQALPRFQRTRGILRLLALWVGQAYQAGFKGARRDPLIGLGTAPLDNPTFRAAVFEQLGEDKLEAAVTTDIVGKKDSHAVRLDTEASDAMRQARLHRQVATTIFFESNGGQTQAQATLPEIRLAAAEPGLEIGHVETALEALAPPTGACFYLDGDHHRYWFSLKPNLTKVHADRRATIQTAQVEEQVLAEVQKVFGAGPKVERVYFPKQSNQIPDRPALTLIVLSPEQSMQQEVETRRLIEAMTREAGASARTFKSALIWAVADSQEPLKKVARDWLAWEAIYDDRQKLRLDEAQTKQVEGYIKTAERDLRESVWRAYNRIALLGKDNTLRVIDMGLVHSSAADSLVSLILNRLRQEGDLESAISPNFLARNWPPAFTEWSTRGVRDAFFASPQFPRLLDPAVVKETIARGVQNKILAYVGKASDGRYEPFHYGDPLTAGDVEITEDMYIITVETAETYHATSSPRTDEGILTTATTTGATTGSPVVVVRERPEPMTPTPPPMVPGATKLTWQGQVPAPKWMNFYMKVLSKFAAAQGLEMTLEVTVTVKADQGGGLSEQKVEETKIALHELGLADRLMVE